MKVLIIDGKNQAHRAFHAYRNLQNVGKPVSIVYGMPSLINALIHQFRPDKIFICWDGRRSKHRLSLLPDYKRGRKQYTDEERAAFNKQIDDVMRVFYYLGVPQIINPDMEADDYIYYLVRKYKKDPTNTINIISNDKDFHQLICKNVRVFNTHKNLLLHEKNLKVHVGYQPIHCVDYLCLVGDKSDNIPGVNKVGDSRAKGFIERFSSIKEYLSSNDYDKLFEKDSLAKIYKRNRQLIDLRVFYKKFVKGKVKLKYYLDEHLPKLNKKELFRLCDHYSIRMFKKTEFIKNYKK